MKKQQDKLNEVTLRRLREVYAERPVRKADEKTFNSAAPDSPLQELLASPPNASGPEAPAPLINFALKAEEFARFRLAALETVGDDELNSGSNEDPKVDGPETQVDLNEPVYVLPTAAGHVATQSTETDERVVQLLSLISDRLPSLPNGRMIRLNAESEGAASDRVRVQAVQLDWHRPLGRSANEPITLTVSLDQEMEPLAQELAEEIIERLDARAAALTERVPEPRDAPRLVVSSHDPDAWHAGLPLAKQEPDAAPTIVLAPTPTASPRAVRRRGLWRWPLVAGVAVIVIVLAVFSVRELEARGHLEGVTDEITSRLELSLYAPPMLAVPEIVLPHIPGIGSSAQPLENQ